MSLEKKRKKKVAPADPFERAKKIRKGELDDEMPDYEELTGWLQRVPETWLPGLLIRVVVMAELQHVFKDKGLESAVARARAMAQEHPLNVLRSLDGED